jgi:AcrR family transcriptional regulator
VSARRVDAARNRQRVLDAAAVEHARHGAALGMHDVARRAGVGIGTVYRHFPSREALIEAIAYPFFERGLALACSVERDHAAGERFHAFVRGFASELAAHGVHGQCTWDAPAAEPVRAELRARIGVFLSDAQRAGAVRPDVADEDAFALLWTVATLVDACADIEPAIWRRHLELALAGLAGSVRAEPSEPPVGRAAWDRFVRSARVRVSRRDGDASGRVA